MADNLKLEESINYLDGNYGTIAADANNSASKLRSRPTSFNSIFEQWRKAIMSSLADLQADLVEAEYPTDENGGLVDTAEEEMDRIITNIAGIENILVNDLDKVPTNYIGKKAIKLKEEMIKQLEEKAKGIYAVPAEKANDVFEQSKIEDEAGNKLGYSLEETKDELASMNQNIPGEEDGLVTPEEVAEVIDGAFNDLEREEETQVSKNAETPARVAEFDEEGQRRDYVQPTDEEIREVREQNQMEEYRNINDTFENELDNNPEEKYLTNEDISDVVDRYMQNSEESVQDDEMSKLIEKYMAEKQRGQELTKERENLKERDRSVNEELEQAKQEATLGEEEYNERIRELKEALLSMENSHNQMQSSNEEMARDIEAKTSDAGAYREKGKYFRDNADQIKSMISQKEGTEEIVETSGRIR